MLDFSEVPFFGRSHHLQPPGLMARQLAIWSKVAKLEIMTVQWFKTNHEVPSLKVCLHIPEI